MRNFLTEISPIEYAGDNPTVEALRSEEAKPDTGTKNISFFMPIRQSY